MVTARKLSRAAHAAPIIPSRSRPRLRVPFYGVTSAAARLALTTHLAFFGLDAAPERIFFFLARVFFFLEGDPEP